MPWRAKDARRHTKKARTPKQKSVWADVANRLLGKGSSDASAIRQANAVVKRMKRG